MWGELLPAAPMDGFPLGSLHRTPLAGRLRFLPRPGTHPHARPSARRHRRLLTTSARALPWPTAGTRRAFAAALAQGDPFQEQVALIAYRAHATEPSRSVVSRTASASGLKPGKPTTPKGGRSDF